MFALYYFINTKDIGAAVIERVESGRVTLEVEEPIPITLGIILKPGAYVGARKRSWLGGEYWVELTAGEIKYLGGVVPSNAEKMEFDVSQYVRQGKILVF